MSLFEQSFCSKAQVVILSIKVSCVSVRAISVCLCVCVCVCVVLPMRLGLGAGLLWAVVALWLQQGAGVRKKARACAWWVSGRTPDGSEQHYLLRL